MATAKTYSVFGDLLSQTTGGSAVTYTYDRLGRLLTEQTNAGKTTAYAYDPAGNKAAVTVTVSGTVVGSQTPVPMSFTTSYAYDPLNRLARVTDPGGRPTDYRYDPAGRLVSVLDRDRTGAGNGSDVPSPYSRRQVFTYDGLGNTTSASWYRDYRGSPDAQPDPTGNVAGVTEVANTYVYNYDSAGNLLISYGVDGQGVQYATHTQTYDPLGRVVTDRTDAGGTLTFTYDAVGHRVETEDRFGDVVTADYDAAGRQILLTRATPGAATAEGYTFSYQADDSASDGPALLDRLTGVSYYTSAAVAPPQSPPALTLTAGYNDEGQASDRTYTWQPGQAGARTEEQFQYTSYDSRGLLTAQTVTGYFSYSETYGYDGQGQVTTSSITLAGANAKLAPGELAVQPTNYDAAGNAPYVNTSALQTAQASGSRVPSDAQNTYFYDGEGNLVRQSAIAKDANGNHAEWRYTYDFNNRVTAATFGLWNEQSGVFTPQYSVTYGYDAEGRLYTRTESSSVAAPPGVQDEYGNPVPWAAGYSSQVVYALDGTRVWAEVDGSAQHVPQTLYLYADGSDTPISRRTGTASVVSWYLTDKQGSVVSLVRASDGVEVKAVRYRSGKAVQRAAENQTTAPIHDRFEFAGQQSDSWTNLVAGGGGQWVNAQLGRYLSQAPGSATDGLPNGYLYANNSWPNLPVRSVAVDPVTAEREYWRDTAKNLGVTGLHDVVDGFLESVRMEADVIRSIGFAYKEGFGLTEPGELPDYRSENRFQKGQVALGLYRNFRRPRGGRARRAIR